VVLLRAKYGPRYHERIGKRIAAINGVWGVYYVLGEYDFVALIRAKNREDYMNKLERLSNMPDIERTITQVTAKIFKEDSRVTI
jgi:DNA-binding Lrp family transcriptional regulator